MSCDKKCSTERRRVLLTNITSTMWPYKMKKVNSSCLLYTLLWHIQRHLTHSRLTKRINPLCAIIQIRLSVFPPFSNLHYKHMLYYYIMKIFSMFPVEYIDIKCERVRADTLSNDFQCHLIEKYTFYVFNSRFPSNVQIFGKWLLQNKCEQNLVTMKY